MNGFGGMSFNLPFLRSIISQYGNSAGGGAWQKGVNDDEARANLAQRQQRYRQQPQMPQAPGPMPMPAQPQPFMRSAPVSPISMGMPQQPQQQGPNPFLMARMMGRRF